MGTSTMNYDAQYDAHLYINTKKQHITQQNLQLNIII